MITAVLKYEKIYKNGTLPPYDGAIGTVTLTKWYSKQIIESHKWLAFASAWNHSTVGVMQSSGAKSPNHGYKIYPPVSTTNENDPCIEVKVEYNTVGKSHGTGADGLPLTKGWAAIEVTLIGIPISINP